MRDGAQPVRHYSDFTLLVRIDVAAYEAVTPHPLPGALFTSDNLLRGLYAELGNLNLFGRRANLVGTANDGHGVPTPCGCATPIAPCNGQYRSCRRAHNKRGIKQKAEHLSQMRTGAQSPVYRRNNTNGRVFGYGSYRRFS